MGTVDAVKAEDVVEAEEVVVVPVRLILLIMWTAQILMSYNKYGPSKVILQRKTY